MLTPAKKLKDRLSAGDTVVGVMASDHMWPLLVELCQKSGLDYLIVDCEHGCHSDETVAHVCQVARLANFPVLVRTISCEPSVIRRTLDLGPSGLILPAVESVDQLDAVRDVVFMPPRGSRRPGGMGNYWMNNFQYSTWLSDFEQHLIVIPQIENRAGLEQATALAQHSLTTALGVGPYDLSADLGCCWDPENADHKAALQQIRAAGDAAGKTVWMGCDVAKLSREGYTFLWTGSISSVLVAGLSSAVAAAQSGRQH